MRVALLARWLAATPTAWQDLWFAPCCLWPVARMCRIVVSRSNNYCSFVAQSAATLVSSCIVCPAVGRFIISA